MKSSFKLNKFSKIVIYGAATTGALIYKKLKKMEFDVVAFSDKRAEEIETYYGLPVLAIQDIKKLKITREDLIVIIAIKNVFEHEFIVLDLLDEGIVNIIYRPKRAVEGIGNSTEEKLNRIYNILFSDKEISTIDIPQIKNIMSIELEKDIIIQEEANEVIVKVPIIYIFSDNYQDKSIIWGNIACLGMIPHIALFQNFTGIQNQYIKLYLEFCHAAANRSGNIVTSKAWEKSVIDNRLDVYENMNREWERGTDFFVKNAVTAKWNPRGYFNIISGKHRIIFQIVKGNNYLPLKISKEDFRIWIAEETANELHLKLQKEKIIKLGEPIIHPYFTKYPCVSTTYYFNFLNKLTYQIYLYFYLKEKKFDISSKSIAIKDITSINVAMLLEKLGFAVTIFLNTKKTETISKLISKLLHCSRVTFCDTTLNFNAFDLILISCAKYRMLTITYQINNNYIVFCNEIEMKELLQECSNSIVISSGYDGNEMKYCIWINWNL